MSEQIQLSSFVNPESPVISRLIQLYGDNLEELTINHQLHILKSTILALEDGNWEIADSIQDYVFEMDVMSGVAFDQTESKNLLLGLVLTAFQDFDDEGYKLIDYCDHDFAQHLISDFGEDLKLMFLQDHLWLINQLLRSLVIRREFSNQDLATMQAIEKSIVDSNLDEDILQSFAIFLTCNVHNIYSNQQIAWAAAYGDAPEIPLDC